MNWGNRLLLVFIVFGIGIFYLVYRANTTNFELVDESYYKNELRYQEVIDGKKNADSLSTLPAFEKNEKGIALQMPAEFKTRPVTGEINFYCSYNSKKDVIIELGTDSTGHQLIEYSHITPGNYLIKFSWADNNKKYYSEQFLTIP
jgi:hypothetical protein